MMWLMAPLVWVSQRITRVIGRGKTGEAHPAGVSRDELVAAARVAQQQGVLGRSEARILQSVFRLGSVRSHDIMTPRTVMFAVNEETPVRDVLVMPELASFSRIPLWREHHDDVIGYVRKDEMLLRAARELNEFFAGERDRFEVPLDLQGTAFQREVWQRLLRIAAGTTRSYGEIAKELGSARAVRAVGSAVGRNPVSVIVPCHRVVGSDGSLTGYAGGVDRKRALLELERALA